jgi:hypothetical protein
MSVHRVQANPQSPVPVMFLTTSLPVGGAETLLADLVRRLDRTRFRPEICCLKGRGTLGDALASRRHAPASRQHISRGAAARFRRASVVRPGRK